MTGAGSPSRGWTRRDLLRTVAAAPLAFASPGASEGAKAAVAQAPRASVRVRRTDSTFEREPLLRPFGFIGGCMTEIWQAVLRMGADSGGARVGIGTQGVLWSDAARRIDLGYGAIALKPIAKTLSMTLRIARLAHQRGIPCFCADLTVNPILVDWNKVVAARLAPLPGFSLGLLETNGHQNYRNWEAMRRYHPCFGSAWTLPERGVFRADRDFYARSGGMFEASPHYEALFRRE
jgi:hypothetical protein